MPPSLRRGMIFARRVMMRIAGEEHATAVPAESIHHFKRNSFRIWGAAAAALVAAVIGIAALMEPSAPQTPPLSIATRTIDDVLVEEAGLALGHGKPGGRSLRAVLHGNGRHLLGQHPGPPSVTLETEAFFVPGPGSGNSSPGKPDFFPPRPESAFLKTGFLRKREHRTQEP